MKGVQGLDYSHRLKGVHPTLAACFVLASYRRYRDLRATSWVRVTEGLRSRERQQELYAAGKSWVKVSRHQFGQAVDFCFIRPTAAGGNEAVWDVEWYRDFWNDYLEPAAEDLGAVLSWGGHWDVVDACHVQIEVLA